MMDFIIPGRCVPKGRPRVTFKTGKAQTYTPARTRNYATAAAWYAKNEYLKAGQVPIPYPRPVSVRLEFILKRQATSTPDVANLTVQLLDVLEGISYENDSQVVHLEATQLEGDIPMTRVIVEES